MCQNMWRKETTVEVTFEIGLHKGKDNQLKKSICPHPSSPTPLPSFLLHLKSGTRGDVRQTRRKGEEGETGPRSSELRTSNLELRTSWCETCNFQLPSAPSWTRSQRLQITRAIFTRLNESCRDEKLFQVNTMIYPLLLVSTWEKRVQRHEWYQWGYILTRELNIFNLSCPPVKIYSLE